MSDDEDISADQSNEEGAITDTTTQSAIPQLTFNEARVLGCLLEKEATTPDNYPLSLNTLHSACNQSSNRNPVTDLGTDEVEEALEDLRYKKLVLMVRQSGARVPKFKHTLEEEFPYMTRSQQSLICVLLLRGQQTAGELRQRTERMHGFNDLDAVEQQLVELINNKPEPLAQRVPAGGGRRVETFIQLLCVEPGAQSATEDSSATNTVSDSIPPPRQPASGRIDDLEGEVEQLRQTVSSMRAEIDDIKGQLGI